MHRALESHHQKLILTSHHIYCNHIFSIYIILYIYILLLVYSYYYILIMHMLLVFIYIHIFIFLYVERSMFNVLRWILVFSLPGWIASSCMVVWVQLSRPYVLVPWPGDGTIPAKTPKVVVITGITIYVFNPVNFFSFLLFLKVNLSCAFLFQSSLIKQRLVNTYWGAQSEHNLR